MNKGKDIRVAQYIFAEIYVVTLAMVFVIFKRCGSVSAKRFADAAWTLTRDGCRSLHTRSSL